MSTPSETEHTGIERMIEEQRTPAGRLDAETLAAAVGNGQGSAQEAQEETKPKRLFGSLTPQEAGRRSALARKAREQSSETAEVQARSDEVKLVRTTVATGQIIQRLSKDAAGGNVQAARELRGWLSELPIETDTDLSALDRRTRQALLAKLLLMVSEEAQEEEQAAAPMEVGHEQSEADAVEAVRPDATPPNDGTPG